MTTATLPTRRSTALPASPIRLKASGLLNSEWIKLRSLRSTVWAYVALIVVQIAFGALLMSLNVNRLTGAEQVSAGDGVSLAVVGATVGVNFGQLIVSVLGVLVISGEYSTGQIRSSFAAVPKRLPVLWAKIAVFSVVTFIVSLVSIVATYLVSWPILAGADITTSLADSNIFVPMLGAAGYLTLVGVIALGLGAILRNTPGGITAALGLLLVAPVVFGLIPADWAHSVSDWLPGSAGMNIFSSGGVFDWWQALLIMLGWIAVFVGTAAVLMRRRDA